MSENIDFSLGKRTFFLFSRPSITEGVARVIDLGATLDQYNYSKNDDAADTAALYNDWLAVGDDLRFSIKKHDRSRSFSRTAK